MRIFFVALIATTTLGIGARGQDSTATDLASFDRIRIQMDAAKADVDQLKEKIGEIDRELMAFRKEYGKEHPEVKRREKIRELLTEVLKVKLENPSEHRHRNRRQIDDFLAGIEERLDELEHAVTDLFEMAEEVAEEAESKIAPLLEDATLEVYHLTHFTAAKAADMLVQLLGENEFRIAVDKDTNTIVVRAPKHVAEVVAQTLQQVETAMQEEAARESYHDDGEHPQSLMMRIFWLADGLPEGEGTEAADYLPTAVLDAIGRSGLRSPRLVSQSSASLATGEIGMSGFHFNFPAVVHGKQLRFQSHGEMVLEGQPRMNLHVEISDQFELGGRITAPLGHYMVLGTANYVDRKTSLEAKLSTSRFAFVVQVIEAESFAPE